MSDFLEFPEYDTEKPRPSQEEVQAAIDAKINKMMGKVIWDEDEEEDFRDRISSDPDAMAYLDQFTESSVETFIDYYLRKRKTIVENEVYNLRRQLNYPRSISSEAKDYFWLIQHKKLFEAQCLWRAKKIDIPIIKITCDFDYWEGAIKYCPFIEPVQPDEVELLKRFLLEKGHEIDVEDAYGSELHNYYEFREEYDNDSGGSYPPFYEYWDLLKGTGLLFRLPDIRGEVEDHYRGLAAKRLRTANNPNADDSDPFKNFKYLSSYEPDDVMAFIDVAGDTEYKKIYTRHTESNKKKAELADFELLELIMDSAGMPTNYPLVTVYQSWRKNIAATISKYKHEIYASELDHIYETYCMERELGLELNLSEEEIRSLEEDRKQYEFFREHILNGREAAGEPRDWSFL